jgi:hypothetical protein
MVPEQKRAWFVLAVFALYVLAVLALVPLLGVHAWAAWGVFGLVPLAGLLFPSKRRPGEVAYDERDRMIREKATLAGGMVSYLVFILACIVPWFIYMAQGRREISIQWLPMGVVVPGFIALIVTRSVVTLVLYGSGAEHDED